MEMIPPRELRFKNSRDRLNRARIHHHAFDEEWRSLVNTEGTSSDIRKDNDSGWYIVSARLPPDRIKQIGLNQLALILGESAYQLRSSLDSLIWDAITYAQGSEPPADANRLEFPILNGKIREFDKCAFHKFPFPKNLSDWMEGIQPDASEKLEGDPDYGLKTTLEDIHDLARFDRHRRLRLVAAIPTSVKLKVLNTTPPGCGVISHEWLNCDLFDGRYDFVKVKIEGPGGISPYHVRIKCDLTFEISAEDVHLYPGDMSIGFQFLRFFAAVERAINRFSEEFN